MITKNIIIRYGNIYSICITREVYKELYKLLSVKDSKFFWTKKLGTRWDGHHRFFSKITGRFNTGLINIVLKYLKEQGYSIKLTGNVPDKIEYKGLNIEGVTLRDYQIEAVQACCRYGRGIINLATNGGKTEIISAVIKEINKPTLILVHKKVLFINMVDRLKKRLRKKIGYINAEGVVIENITVAMTQSCVHYIKNKKNKPVMKIKPEIKNILKGIDLVIIDEHQHSKSKMFYKLLTACSATYRYGFTGTADMPEKVDAVRLRANTGSIICRVSNKFLIENEYSAVPIVRVIDLPRIVDLSITFSDYYDNQIINNKYRNNLIKEICLQYSKNILILIKNIRHGKLLEQMILGSTFIHGSTSDIEEQINNYRKGNIKVLIASSVLDEGVDLTNIDVLILGGGGLAKNILLQRIGRGLRVKEGKENKVYIYDFNDNGKYLKTHARARQRVYKKEGFEVAHNYILKG